MSAESENRQDDRSGGPALAGPSSMRDPIAALATAPGAGAIAVIRVSGSGCLSLLERYLRRYTAVVKPRRMLRAEFIDPDTGSAVDDLMVAVFPGPQSFTGEDSAEIFCHGGPYIVQKILQLLWQQGCRPAEPGEFTRRAFLNGKMDLSAAEGIKELVAAGTHQQWLAARQLATGRFAEAIEQLRAALIEAMAYLAARIDFPDEGDTQGVDLGIVTAKVRKVMERIQRLESSYASGRVAARGLMVTILGPPNMGKSTLMNTLLGHERAIVTDVAGTTRDYLEEPCRVRGRLIRLVDTAGVREAQDTIERLGIARSLQLAQEADLVLLLLSADAADHEREAAAALKSQLGSGKCLEVLTKSDLGVPAWARDLLPISCQAERGLEALEQHIVRLVDGHIAQLQDEPFVSSARHLVALASARKGLDAYFAAEEQGQYDELLAFELQHAARALSGILGSVDVEDILDKIFRDFCVGK